MATAIAVRPVEPARDGTVIRFKKYDQSYTYAAIRHHGLWFLTQSGKQRYHRDAQPWVDLVDWIGERNWNTIEVLS